MHWKEKIESWILKKRKEIEAREKEREDQYLSALEKYLNKKGYVTDKKNIN